MGAWACYRWLVLLALLLALATTTTAPPQMALAPLEPGSFTLWKLTLSGRQHDDDRPWWARGGLERRDDFDAQGAFAPVMQTQLCHCTDLGLVDVGPGENTLDVEADCHTNPNAREPRSMLFPGTYRFAVTLFVDGKRHMIRSAPFIVHRPRRRARHPARAAARRVLAAAPGALTIGREPKGGARRMLGSRRCAMRTLSRDDAHVLAVWERVVIVVFEKEARASSVNAVIDAIRAEHAQAGPVTLLDVVAAKTKPPDAETRAAFARLLEEGRTRLAAGALVTEGDGFFNAFVRSVITGLTFAARPPFPVEVVPSVAEGAAFLARTAGVDAAALSAVVDELRR